MKHMVLFLIIFKAVSEAKIGIRFYRDSSSFRAQCWTENMKEYKTKTGFESEVKLISEDGLKLKKEMLTPSELITTFKLLADNAIEDEEKIIPLSSPWQLLNLSIGGIKFDRDGSEIFLNYKKVELSSQEAVIFVGFENFAQQGQFALDILSFLSKQATTFTRVRLFGLAKTKPKLDQQLTNTMYKINSWFFVDPSKTIHWEKKWPSNWYYLRNITDPVYLNIPEENEIIMGKYQDNSAIANRVLQTETNWRDLNWKQYVQGPWLPNQVENFLFTGKILTLLPKPSPRKFLEYKLLGEGNTAKVKLVKDLDNLGYIAIKEGKNLEYEYRIHTEIYKLANGMRVNGTQRLRIPTPLFLDVDANKYCRCGMSVLGPSFADLDFFRWATEETMRNLFLGYIVPQSIIQLYLFHKTGCLHLDIKTDNFMLGPWGQESLVYIADFTTCRKYSRGMVAGDRLGSPPYMSLNMMKFGAGHFIGWKDDWESFIYMIFEFLRKELPWDPTDDHNDAEEYFQYVLVRKEELFGSCESINTDDEVMERLIRLLRYIRALEPDEMPNLEYMLNIMNLNKEMPPIEQDGLKRESAHAHVPSIPPPIDFEKTIFGLSPREWRRYVIHHVTDDDTDNDFEFNPKRQRQERITIFVMEEALMLITKDAPIKKYHGNVDFGIRYSKSNNSKDDVMYYGFLLPGAEEFIFESYQENFILVLVTHQPLAVAAGLAKFELFLTYCQILHLKDNETLQSKGILDENGNIAFPNITRIYDKIRINKRGDKSKVTKDTLLYASFENRHLPYLTVA